MHDIDEDIPRRVFEISFVHVEAGNCIWIVEVGVKAFVGVSDTIIVLAGFETVVGLNVIAQLEKKPAVSVTPWVPAVSEVSKPIVPVKPVAVIAGLGLITLLTTATTVAT